MRARGRDARRLPEFLRFLAVTFLGLLIDIGIGWTLIGSGAGDLPAAAVGLLAGMVVNYLLHLRWTFRDHGRRAGAGHFLTFALTTLVTLGIRLGVLGAIGWLGMQHLLHPVARLAIAAGLSFLAGYLLSRHVVFRPQDAPAPDQATDGSVSVCGPER